MGRVVFRLGKQRQSVGLADAMEIQSRAVENSLSAQALHSELGRMIRGQVDAAASGDDLDGEIVLDDESRTREQLLLCLAATEDEDRMTDDLEGRQNSDSAPEQSFDVRASIRQCLAALCALAVDSGRCGSAWVFARGLGSVLRPY
jgi:hypothetical protein